MVLYVYIYVVKLKYCFKFVLKVVENCVYFIKIYSIFEYNGYEYSKFMVIMNNYLCLGKFFI